MRFFLSLFIWLVIVGGLFLYTWQRDAGLPQGPSIVEAAKHVKGDHLLEITPTFSVVKDPFALQSDTDETALLELRLNGKNLEAPAMDMRRGEVIRIRGLTELQVGFNEFYISASPPITENMLDHGIRVRLLDGSSVLLDDTIWASSGALVSGTINFTLAAETDDDHEH
jgi:hypothetical protein